MLHRSIYKVTKFQLPTPKCFSTVVKNILMSNRVKSALLMLQKPGDSVTNETQINSQSNKISMSSFAGPSTSRSDPLYT